MRSIANKEYPHDIVDRTLVQEAITLSIGLNENPHQLWQRVEVKDKIGYWVRWYEVKEYSGWGEHNPHCKCSECGREYDPHLSQFIKYCPNCGTRLVEQKKVVNDITIHESSTEDIKQLTKESFLKLTGVPLDEMPQIDTNGR